MDFRLAEPNSNMDFDRIIKFELRTRENHRLKTDLDFLDLLRQRNRQEAFPLGISDDTKKRLSLLKDLIVKREYNRYSENNPDTTSNPFKDLNYDEKEKYTQIAYFLAAEEISKKNECTLEDLDYYEENTDWGFLLGLSLTHDKLQELIDGIVKDVDNVLHRTRDMASRTEDLYNFCKQELTPNLSDEEIMAKIGHYNDGSYIELPGYVRLVGHLCLQAQEYDLWCELLTDIEYFALQAALIVGIQDFETYLNIVNVINDNKPKHQKVIMYLLRERLLRIVSDNIVHLSNNSKDELLTPEFRKIAFDILYKMVHRRIELASNIFDIYIASFGIDNVRKWIADEKYRLVNPTFHQQKLQQSILKLFLTVLLERDKTTTKKYDDYDFPTLCLCAEEVNVGNVTEKNSKLLIEAICASLFESEYIRPFTIEDNSLHIMRNIYNVLLKSGEQPLMLSQNYFKPSEGYNVRVDDVFKYQGRLLLWYSIVMLSFEKLTDKSVFLGISSRLIEEVQFVKLPHSNEVVLPLYVGELVVSQVLKEAKRDYEMNLIHRIPYLQLVLRVMSANEGDMEKAVKDSLLRRIYTEWEYEKNIMETYDKKLLAFLDEYVNKIRQ